MKYFRDEIGIKKFGRRVKELRLSKKLTQEDVAWEANIEPMQLIELKEAQLIQV